MDFLTSLTILRIDSDLGRRTVLKKFRKLAFIDVVHLGNIRAEKDVSGNLQCLDNSNESSEPHRRLAHLDIS